MKLKTLLENENSWKIVNRLGRLYFEASGKSLKSLKGCPTEGYENFNVDTNLLTSLEFGPTIDIKMYFCQYNLLTSLEYAPKVCKEMYAGNNKLEHLKGIGRDYLTHCELLQIHDNDFKSHLLGIMLIKNLRTMKWGTPDTISTLPYIRALDIIFNYYSSNWDFLDCQEELISKGLKDYAKL